MRHAMRGTPARSARRCLLAAAVMLAPTVLGPAGCVQPQYGVERQLSLLNGTHPVWAVAPAVNLSGESHVDPLLQADLLFKELQSVNNLTIIPVNRVVEVYAALHIDRVENPEQAALVCEQLGCDALVVPTTTIYDPYDPPKLGAALQLLPRTAVARSAQNIDPRELTRRATPMEISRLPVNPGFIQVVGMYDAQDGSTRAGVLAYARGRNDPLGPLREHEYFVSMDRYCGFVYHTLIDQLLQRVTYEHPGPDHPRPPADRAPEATARVEPSPADPSLTVPPG